jgi:ribA/ribD-fused uncharacterized protein
MEGIGLQQAEYLREIKELRIKLCTITRRHDVMVLESKLNATSKTPAPPPAPPPNQSEKVRIVKGKWDPMSNFYRFMFVFRGAIFDSAEKAFQYFKALKSSQFDLCRRIQNAHSALEAKRLSHEIDETSYSEDFEFDLMSEILQEKVRQCRSFRDDLRASSGSRILHSTYRDKDLYWATGLDFRDKQSHYGPYSGYNVFGKQLEWVRKGLLDEKDYETMVDVREDGDFALILFDGEESIYKVSQKPKDRGSPPSSQPRPVVRQRTCFYCHTPGHIMRDCRRKWNDERKRGRDSFDSIRDPVVRARMVRWRDEKKSGRQSMTFHRTRQPANVNTENTQRVATEAAPDIAPSIHVSTVDDLLTLGDHDADNMSVSSNDSVVTAIPTSTA